MQYNPKATKSDSETVIRLASKAFNVTTYITQALIQASQNPPKLIETGFKA